MGLRAMRIDLEQSDLQPLVQTIVDETLERIESVRANSTDDQLAFTEP